MSTTLSTTEFADQFAMPPFPVRRWSVEEYHELARSGFIAEGDPLELLEGWIVPKMTHSPPHVWAVSRLEKLLTPHLSKVRYIRVQSPISTHDSEPEPDLAVVRGTEDDYLHSHPTTGDIDLVVEVAESSLSKDRRKAQIYASAAIPEYWIVNLSEGVVERYSDPDSKSRAYRGLTKLQRGDELDVQWEQKSVGTLAVNDMLPADA